VGQSREATIVADYVLIHGGHKDGSIWGKVVPLLEEQGHRVFAPSLPDPATSTLSEFISVVCKIFEGEGLESVFLVGHSSGALVITGVADRIPERIQRLIYVDSSVPIVGKSLYGMFEDLGISPTEYDLPQDPPCLEPLYFDEEKILEIPKTYILCKQGEFIAVARPFFEKIKENAERDNWNYYTLDSKHECMVSHPVELARILLE
jgi:pimeloyl-ACP methyl ester carboxylesterase